MKIKLIKFQKPTHWTEGQAWINLNIEEVKRAKTNEEMIVIELPQGFCKPVSPSILLKYGKKTEAVYLYPQNPMKLVGAYYSLLSPNQQEQAKSDPYFWNYEFI